MFDPWCNEMKQESSMKSFRGQGNKSVAIVCPFIERNSFPQFRPSLPPLKEGLWRLLCVSVVSCRIVDCVGDCYLNNVPT